MSDERKATLRKRIEHLERTELKQNFIIDAIFKSFPEKKRDKIIKAAQEGLSGS